MVNIKYYELDTLPNNRLKIAIIMARYKDKWILVRHKARSTWEIPAGHREMNEDIGSAASRELIEETGAKDFSITPVSIYGVLDKGIESFGQLFYADIKSLGKLPDFEIEEIGLFETMPKNITYPLVQPQIFKRIEEYYRCLKREHNKATLI